MARGLPDSNAAWTWERLAGFVPPHVARRALDDLVFERVEVHDGGPHAAGRVGAFDVGVDLRTGGGSCACLLPAPCVHMVALIARACGLDPVRAPASVRNAWRVAFRPEDPPTPVPAYPETSSDLEVPADALSEAQRAAVEETPGVVRKSATVYAVPRDHADGLAARLEALGSTLLVYSRRPFVKFRASLKPPTSARLLATETPGLGVRSLLEAHGFSPVRKPKSLVHEFVGPVVNLHILGESLGEQGTAVLLADRAPPSFEPLSVSAPIPRAKLRAPTMPVIFSRKRFEWWTPRESLTPLQFAIIARHGHVGEKGYLLGTESLRAVEREMVAAGLHAHRVEDPMPREAHVEVGPREGETRIRTRIGDAAALQVLHRNGYQFDDTRGAQTVLEGPTANLPLVAVGLAQAGVHLLPPPEGWPPLPDTPADTLFADDPRAPVTRAGVLEAQDERVQFVVEPAGSVLPRSVRIDLYRVGWLAPGGEVVAPLVDAGRLLALLREAGIDARWPRPTETPWRLSSIRYSERSHREGGGTLLHLKGPIPLGRLGGVDPGEEAQRIQQLIHAMETALQRHHPEAKPLAHGAMPGVWTVRGGAGAFLLEAAAHGASVTPAPTFQPLPVGRGVVLVDTTCLPPRLTEYHRVASDESTRIPVVSPEIERVVRRIVPEGLEVDPERGHYLVPSTRMGELVAALRELGAKVLNRRLAPKGKRYARWEPILPEDETGARPKLRPAFKGRYDGKVPGLRPECVLDPHQREGLAFILHNEYSCLLADEMGLGKTLQAITAAQFLPGRVLVVCPASARDVWKTEVHGWTFEQARVLVPKDRASDFERSDAGEKYVIVAYSGLTKFADAIAHIPFDLVILDESHYVKSRAAQRTRIVEERLRGIPRRLILSGTPVMNEPKEIRTQLAFVHPDEWSDIAWFNRRFQRPWKDGTPEVREQVLGRLRDYLGGIMLRREKRIALPDLPEKRLHVRRLELPREARQAYDEQEDEFRDYVRENEETALAGDMAATAGRIERLKQTALVGKLPLIVEAIHRLVEGGDKVVVFSHYREPIRAMGKELARHGVVTLTGSTAAEDRGKLVKRFQVDPNIRIFIGQTLAAGVAVTLTAAKHAIFTDLEWNPAVHRQAMDRIHRKTQTRDVDVHFYLADDTVEETIAEVLEEKTEMMDQLLEGRKGGTFGLREKEGAQREVALRLLARRRRRKTTAVDDDDD